MVDYYSILGVSKHATNAEIKAAFRKLAKLYHPDKNPNNPNARTLFESILNAYNILSNPITRKKYDSGYSINIATTTVKNRKVNKERNVEDIKQREKHYYQKYYQAAQQAHQRTTQTKTSYSDYKYVLLATPVAVLLLMLIVSLFANEPTLNSQQQYYAAATNTTQSKIVSGNTPYSGYFGLIRTFNTNHKIKFSNQSNADLVLVLFDKTTDFYLQHCYLQNASSVEFNALPSDGVYYKCMIGSIWNPDKLLLNNKVIGGFENCLQYQNTKQNPISFTQNKSSTEIHLDILPQNTENKKYITDDVDFFELPTIK